MKNYSILVPLNKKRIDEMGKSNAIKFIIDDINDREEREWNDFRVSVIGLVDFIDGNSVFIKAIVEKYEITIEEIEKYMVLL